MRPTLLKHPKFRRLCSILGIPRPHAIGHLELLWETAYESGEPFIGDSVDVELAAEWQGEVGALTDALVNCGGPGRVGFLDRDESGGYSVHDLFDHCPSYVKKRMVAEDARRRHGKTISCLRSEAGKKGAAARWAKQIDDTEMANGWQMDGKCHKKMANGWQMMTPPAPAPAPAPAPNTIRQEEEESKSPEPETQLALLPPLPPLQPSAKLSKPKALSAEEIASRYLACWCAVLDKKRLITLGPTVIKKVGERIKEGYHPLEIIAAPILKAAQGDLDKMRGWTPDVLLRDGSHPRNHNGQTSGITHHLSVIQQKAADTKLDYRLADIARQFGVLEALERNGVETCEQF